MLRTAARAERGRLCVRLLLYRFARASFGGVVASAALPAVFIPALPSMSALRPMNVFALAAELLCAVYVVRAFCGRSSWRLRAWCRWVWRWKVCGRRFGDGDGGTVAGAAGAWLLARGRRLLTALMVAPFAIAALASMPPVQIAC